MTSDRIFGCIIFALSSFLVRKLWKRLLKKIHIFSYFFQYKSRDFRKFGNVKLIYNMLKNSIIYSRFLESEITGFFQHKTAFHSNIIQHFK